MRCQWLSLTRVVRPLDNMNRFEPQRLVTKERYWQFDNADGVEFIAEEKGTYQVVAATRDVTHLKGLVPKPAMSPRMLFMIWFQMPLTSSSPTPMSIAPPMFMTSR